MRYGSINHYNDLGSPIQPILSSGTRMVRRRQAGDPLSHTDEHTQQLARPASWTEQGICWDRQTSLPIPAYDADFVSASQSELLCASCPVRELCLQAAMAEEGMDSARLRHGVRGGLNPAQRAELARKAVA